MVINFDVPREAEDYVHRIGRTARANREGEAVTFVSPDEMFRLRKIEKLLEKEIPREEVPAEFGEAPRPGGEDSHERGRGRKRGNEGRGRGRKDRGDRKKTEVRKDSKDRNRKNYRGRGRRKSGQSAVSSSKAISSTSDADSTK